jgi:hypothetical protein
MLVGAVQAELGGKAGLLGAADGWVFAEDVSRGGESQPLGGIGVADTDKDGLALSGAARIGQTAVSAATVTRPGPAGRPLGSPDFYPSAERPVGWRGDWSGRFPGATPPTDWSRRVKGVASDLRYQARKPTGDPGAGSCRMEYFTLRDWLVAGPFAVDDAEKDINRDLLGGESTVEPDAGGKAAGATWQPLHVNVDTQSRHDHNEGTCGHSYVDFIYLYGKIKSMEVEKIEIEGDFTNKAAYAHTYIHSPAEAKVRLRMPFAGTAARFWLNGTPADQGTVVGANSLPGGSGATPMFSGKRVFVRGGEFLYCVGAE